MTLTPEILKMHQALQPKFRKAMGEWREGDWYWSESFKELSTVCDYCDKNDAGEWRNFLNHAIRLPLPIDPVNPERGLWGMVDWEKLFTSVRQDGMIKIFKIDHSWGVDYTTPTEALLRALMHQWEVK